MPRAARAVCGFYHSTGKAEVPTPAGYFYRFSSCGACFDSLRFCIYENGSWGEIQTLYMGNLGNVKSLDVSMTADGTAAVAYTVDTDPDAMENGAGYEILVSLIHPKTDGTGNGTQLVRLSSNTDLDENARITAAVFPDGEERFVAAWYSGGADSEGISTSDIRLASFGIDGILDTDFADSLSEISATTGASVTSNFDFAKGSSLSLSELTLIWSEPVLAYDEENKAEAQSDCLKAVKFCYDEKTGKIYLTPAQEVAAMPQNTLLDHFDAWVEGNTVKAVLLSSAYEGELEQVTGDVYVVDPISSMQTASAEFRNTIHVESITMDPGELAAGGRLTVAFSLSNRGISPVTSLDIQVGEGEKQEIPVDRLLPNSRLTQTYVYRLPETIEDADYKITAHFADGSTAQTEGTLNLDIPDVAVSTLNMREWGDGMRSFTALLANRSDVALQDNPNRKVYLAVYSDSNCEEESRVPFYVDGQLVEKGENYEISGDASDNAVSELAMLDDGNLVLDLGYDIREDLEDGLFPAGGITLYVRAWAEETAPGAEGGDPETYELAELDENNNARSITFTDPVEAAGGVMKNCMSACGQTTVPVSRPS